LRKEERRRRRRRRRRRLFKQVFKREIVTPY